MTIHERLPTTQDDSTDSDDRGRRAGRGERTATVVLLVVVLSSILSVGVLAGAPPPGHPDSAAEGCPPVTEAANHVAWHVERYGAGCHANEFTRFPEGEQIDHIGDPPWIPL